MNQDTPIDELELTMRARNCLLYGSEIRTVGQLAAASDKELLEINNLGRGTLRELREILAQFPSDPEPQPQFDPAMLDWVREHQELITILMHGTKIAQVQIIIPVERS